MNKKLMYYSKGDIFVYSYVINDVYSCEHRAYSQAYSAFTYNKQSYLVYSKNCVKNALSCIKLMLSLKDKNSITYLTLLSPICDSNVKYIISNKVTKQIFNTIGRHYYDNTLCIKKYFVRSMLSYYDNCMAEEIFRIIKKELPILFFDFYYYIEDYE